MKNIFFLALTLFLLASCSKSTSNTEICSTELNCNDEECLFTLNNVVGVTAYLTCYDAWAIRQDSDSGINKWYIVDEWNDSYKENDIEVRFCGYVRTNTRPLILPDPMPGEFYQINLADIEVGF